MKMENKINENSNDSNHTIREKILLLFINGVGIYTC